MRKAFPVQFWAPEATRGRLLELEMRFGLGARVTRAAPERNRHSESIDIINYLAYSWAT